VTRDRGGATHGRCTRSSAGTEAELGRGAQGSAVVGYGGEAEGRLLAG
jgi:hypothetical protein